MGIIMAGIGKKISCSISNKHNIRIFKRTIKSFVSLNAFKQRIRIRLTAEYLCLHTSAIDNGLDRNGRYLMMYPDFFKEMIVKEGNIELEVDLKTLSQTIATTKDQSELCIQMEKKSNETGILRLLSSREAIYDKIVKIKANVTALSDLPEFNFTPENIAIESPSENFDRFLSIFSGETEAAMSITQDSLEFYHRKIDPDKTRGLCYSMNTNTFSKYSFPISGVSGNMETILPLEIAILIVEIAKERSLPIRIVIESLNKEIGNIFFICEPPTKEFRCIGTALSVKMIPQLIDNTLSLNRTSIKEKTIRDSNISEIGIQEEQKVSTIQRADESEFSQNTLTFLNMMGGAKSNIKDDSKLSQKSFFGGGVNDDYI